MAEDQRDGSGGEAFDIFELTTAGRPQLGIDGDFVVVPEGYKVEDLERFDGTPRRARARHALRDVQSLAFYATRFATGATVAFAEWSQCIIDVVVDYHHPVDGPGHCEHFATFIARRTPSWESWRAAHDKAMSQIEFGRFLEERAHEIVEPVGADVVEVAMNLDAIKRVTFRSAQRLSDGYRQFQYSEDNEARGGVRVPEVFTILVGIFEGQEPTRIRARLRYRIDDGRLKLWLSFDNIDDIERVAFERCIDAFALDAPDGLPIYRGSPDVPRP